MIVASRRVVGVRRFASLTMPPLSEPFEGVKLATGVRKMAPRQVTTLPNGVRVVSQDNGDDVSVVNVVFAGGSRADTKSGVAHVVAKSALKSTTSRSEFRVMRDLENAAARLGVSAARETLSFELESTRTSLASSFGLLADSVKNSRFTGAEVRDIRPFVERDIAALESSSTVCSFEAAHTAAFRAEGLGKSITATMSGLDAICHSCVGSYMKARLAAPEHMVVSAVNVDHAALVKLATESFGSLAASSSSSPLGAASKYVGGESRTVALAPGASSAVTIAFSAPHLAAGRASAAAAVAHALLGSFESGYTASVNSSSASLVGSALAGVEGVVSAHAFYAPYSDAGLLGVTIEASPCALQAASAAVMKCFEQLATSALSKEFLVRGQRRVAAGLAMNAESRACVAASNASSVLFGATDLAAEVAHVTAQDVQSMMSAARASKATIAVHGADAQSVWRVSSV